MLKISEAEYRTISRYDLYTFIHRAFRELNPTVPFLHTWHNELIAAKLEACLRHEINRLIINVPPRSLKSHDATVAFPAYVLGHNPSAQLICASYGQDLANKHALDCRTLMTSAWYKHLFPRTCLSSQKQSLQELVTTRNGFRLATSVGGVLTGRGAEFIIIDDPLKPYDALSEAQRNAANEWFDHTLYSRLNDKRTGCIIIIMQRLHEDDLVGHVLEQEKWELVRLPAIAEKEEVHIIRTALGTRAVHRHIGEALHPERESLELLHNLRRTIGEYNFAGQYQQAPAPFGGGLVKREWLTSYTPAEIPARWDFCFESWDTANKPSELSDYSVCTTWGVKGNHLYLLWVLRERLDYPALKRAVREQAHRFSPTVILIEDEASGTQLIQELTYEGVHAIKKYKPTMDKIMRLHTTCASFENGFVHLPEKAAWLDAYVHELMCFPRGKFDDQVDSTSQALDWFKQRYFGPTVTFGRVEL
jgi:predicted phage terminase large subunit-like protein